MTGFAIAPMASLQIKRHASLYDIARRQELRLVKLLKNILAERGGFELANRGKVIEHVPVICNMLFCK